MSSQTTPSADACARRGSSGTGSSVQTQPQVFLPICASLKLTVAPNCLEHHKSVKTDCKFQTVIFVTLHNNRCGFQRQVRGRVPSQAQHQPVKRCHRAREFVGRDSPWRVHRRGLQCHRASLKDRTLQLNNRCLWHTTTCKYKTRKKLLRGCVQIT